MSQVDAFMSFLTANYVAVEEDAEFSSGVTAASKVFLSGISDGGRLSVMGALFNHQYPYVHCALAIGGTPVHGYDSIPMLKQGAGLYPLVATSGVRAFAYWSSNDNYYASAGYDTLGIWQGFGSAISSSWGTSTYETTWKNQDFKMESQKKGCQYATRSAGGEVLCDSRWEISVSKSPDYTWFINAHGSFCADTALMDEIYPQFIGDCMKDIPGKYSNGADVRMAESEGGIPDATVTGNPKAAMVPDVFPVS